MYYHNISKCDMLNGEGLRVVLWLAGCEHKCLKCHNPQTWSGTSGVKFNEKAKEELFSYLKQDNIQGVTFSGGDGLYLPNIEKITLLMREIKKVFPKKDIWCYTGYLYEEVKGLEAMQYVDALVDGKFEIGNLSPSLPWVGSNNQRIINVQESLKKGEVILHELSR